MISKERISSRFRQLEQGVKDRLAEIDSPLAQAIGILFLSGERFGFERLTLSEIADCLEEAGVSLSIGQLQRALARSGGRVKVSTADGKATYRLMSSGRKQAESALSLGNISIIHIIESHPRTARSRIEDIFTSFSGLIRISDPYFGLRTLDAIANIPIGCTVRFLTANIEKNPRLPGALVDFRLENPDFELRSIQHGSLHDRYVLTGSHLMIVGHGLKDIGNKESFVVLLARSYVADLLDELTRTFDRRWIEAGKV